MMMIFNGLHKQNANRQVILFEEKSLSLCLKCYCSQQFLPANNRINKNQNQQKSQLNESYFDIKYFFGLFLCFFLVLAACKKWVKLRY